MLLNTLYRQVLEKRLMPPAEAALAVTVIARGGAGSALYRRTVGLPHTQEEYLEEYRALPANEREAVNAFVRATWDLGSAEREAWKRENPGAWRALQDRALAECEKQHGGGECGLTWGQAVQIAERRGTPWWAYALGGLAVGAGIFGAVALRSRQES